MKRRHETGAETGVRADTVPMGAEVIAPCGCRLVRCRPPACRLYVWFEIQPPACPEHENWDLPYLGVRPEHRWPDPLSGLLDARFADAKS